MPKYQITKPAVRQTSRFAIGLDTNTLFVMHKNGHMGTVIVGRGIFAGREGELVDAWKGRGVKYLHENTIIELMV